MFIDFSLKYHNFMLWDANWFFLRIILARVEFFGNLQFTKFKYLILSGLFFIKIPEIKSTKYVY